MKHKFLKLIVTILIVLLSITSLSIADDHISKKEMISELRKEITEFGEKPINAKKMNQSYVSTPSFERKRIAGKKKVKEFRDGFKILTYMIRRFLRL